MTPNLDDYEGCLINSEPDLEGVNLGNSNCGHSNNNIINGDLHKNKQFRQIVYVIWPLKYNEVTFFGKILVSGKICHILKCI